MLYYHAYFLHQDSPEFVGQNFTNIWNAVTKEFFDGWTKGPNEQEAKLIEQFIGMPRFKKLLLKFIDESLVETGDLNYSNYTEVCISSNYVI